MYARINIEVLKMLLLIVGIVFAESRDECIGWRQGEDGISNGISNEILLLKQKNISFRKIYSNNRLYYQIISYICSSEFCSYSSGVTK